MKRLAALAPLMVGLVVGFLCGVALTSAFSDQAKISYDQVVARAGETSVTRARLAEYAMAEVGPAILRGRLKAVTLAEEGARRAGVTVATEDVTRRVNEYYKFAEMQGKSAQLEQVPRFVIEDNLRASMLVEKMLNLNVTADDARDFYAKNSARYFMQPAAVRLICIITDTDTDAKKIVGRLKAGEDPQRLADIYCIDEKLRSVHGDLGWYSRDLMSPEVAEAIFSANAGKGLRVKEFTNPIPHQNPDTGKMEYLVFYIKDRREAKTPTFEEVRDAAIFFARSQRYAQLAPPWFEEQAKAIEWWEVKDLFDPLSQLERIPPPERRAAPQLPAPR